MAFEEDILQLIPYEDLPKLREMYKSHMPYATHVYSFFTICLKWIRKRPNESRMTFLAPYGDWKKDGTFVVILQWGCYDLFMCTLDVTCQGLHQALVQTKRINWNNRMQFYFVHRLHCPVIYKVIKELNLHVSSDVKTDLWWIPREQALQFDIACPPEVYVAPLKPNQASTINSIWPHKFPGSEDYVRNLIKVNGGFGLYLKTNDKLVAWVLKNFLGTMVVLQTLEEYKRRGYASLVVRAMSRDIAEEGHNPLGTVVTTNSPSQGMFAKLGFQILDYARFIGIDGRNNHHSVTSHL